MMEALCGNGAQKAEGSDTSMMVVAQLPLSQVAALPGISKEMVKP
jgi:hypothetical protein